MSIKDKYEVRQIQKEETYPWLLGKHYAHRKPPISYAFGLYNNKILKGVCTFGPPARMLNNGYGVFGGLLKIDTYELNRLVIDDMPVKNVLSFFVSRVLMMLDTPCCIVSYADGTNGHHGYIYQATNWVYTGITSTEKVYTNTRTSKIIHPRTVVDMFGSRESSVLPGWIKISKEKVGKYRYFKFLGSKKAKKKMLTNLKYKVLPYPKGDNKRYDASYTPDVQGLLF